MLIPCSEKQRDAVRSSQLAVRDWSHRFAAHKCVFNLLFVCHVSSNYQSCGGSSGDAHVSSSGKECGVKDNYQSPSVGAEGFVVFMCLMQAYSSNWIPRIYSVCITTCSVHDGCRLFIEVEFSNSFLAYLYLTWKSGSYLAGKCLVSTSARAPFLSWIIDTRWYFRKAFFMPSSLQSTWGGCILSD